MPIIEAWLVAWDADNYLCSKALENVDINTFNMFLKCILKCVNFLIIIFFTETYFNEHSFLSLWHVC